MIIINEINIYNSNFEIKPPVDSKWIIEFFDDVYHNKIYENPSSIWPQLSENGVFDLEPGTSYSNIENINDLEQTLKNIIGD